MGRQRGCARPGMGPATFRGFSLSLIFLFFFFSAFWPAGGQPQSLQVVQSYSDKDTFVPVFCFSAEPDGWLGCGDVFFQLEQPPPPFAPGLSGALEMFLHLTLHVIMGLLSQKQPPMYTAAASPDFQRRACWAGGEGRGIAQILWEQCSTLRFFIPSVRLELVAPGDTATTSQGPGPPY